MIAALKSKGVPVFWVGLPAIRGTRSTADMVYLDDLYRARAERAGIIYVDIWDGFVDESGRYVTHGPDFEGQMRRLRSGDGVHFTKAGARKLAHYVEREICALHEQTISCRWRCRRRAERAEAGRERTAACRRPGAAADRARRISTATICWRRRPHAAGAKPIRWPTRVLGTAIRWRRRPAAPTISPGRARRRRQRAPLIERPRTAAPPAPAGAEGRRQDRRRRSRAMPRAQPSARARLRQHRVRRRAASLDGAPEKADSRARRRILRAASLHASMLAHRSDDWLMPPSRVSAAAASIPSGICRPRARPGGLRGSPTPPATGRGACRRRRTPCRARCGSRR